jgi:4-amino-4-deoxy-L-arabinose transferase-like glycosyltransferase
VAGLHLAANENGRQLWSKLGEAIRYLAKPSTLLFSGFCLRIIVFAFLNPHNNDHHAEVIKFVIDQGRLPFSDELSQAYQPPLYYILAAPILWFSGSIKAVQVLSLIFSIATLIVIYRLFLTPPIRPEARAYSIALACFLPQFVMFTLYVSNDTLAIFIGSAIAFSLYEFIECKDWRQLLGLATLVGLGLATKATFLVFVPILLLLVSYVSFSKPASGIAARVAKPACFLLIVTILGGYKYLDNYLHFHDPFINNLDMGYSWAASQKKTYKGLASYADFDPLQLLASPTVEPEKESYPLLLFGTFWYQHIAESNFMGNLRAPLKYLGSFIYFVAIVPTLTFLVGLGYLIYRIPIFLCRFRCDQAEDKLLLWEISVVILLVANFALLLAAVAKYHVWSIMQSRLLFPCFVGGLTAFAKGISIAGKYKVASTIFQVAFNALIVLFLLYFASEISLRVLSRFSRP